tara:strand:+ start:292 stop:423 length:132 start_codon:yes stop_codon:yes gene_type:complete
MGLEIFDSKIHSQLLEMVNGIYTDKDLITMMENIVKEYRKEEK